jgi:hypothetical protein
LGRKSIDQNGRNRSEERRTEDKIDQRGMRGWKKKEIRKNDCKRGRGE